MAKLSIVTSGHFSTSPRVWREADALAKAGHDVTVIGVSYDPLQAEMDRAMLRSRSWRYRAAADLRPHSFSSRMRRLLSRMRSRWGRFCLARGFPDPHAFGYAVGSLREAALAERADLTILHLEPALWVGGGLRRAGLLIGVDIEDWYSENRIGGAKNPEISYLRSLESGVLKMAAHATTMSHAMAAGLANAYEIPSPEVIYNSVPALVSTHTALADRPLRLLWFSQTIGPGRGLEDLFGALPHLKGAWVLQIRGHASVEAHDWLEAQIPSAVRGQVQIVDFVAPDQLGDVIAESDLGLALDPPWGRNKDLTVSNKLLHYLQEGLTVVAADTKGVREIKSLLPEAVHLYPAGHVQVLADLLNQCIRERPAILSRRDLISRSANQHFGYEAQAPRLLASVDRALARGHQGMGVR